MSAPYRPVFVLGTGRCGSTLVHEVLARHEDTGFVTNLDDLGLRVSSSAQNRLWRRLPAGVTEKGGARFAPSEAYRVIGKEVGPVLVDPVRDLTARDATPWLRQRMRAFVDRRADRLDAGVFLHKLTGWPRAGFVEACLPESVFVEVVRDGRAVANSWVQMPWWHGHRGPSEWHFGPLSEADQDLWDRHDRSFPVLAAIGWRLLMERYDEVRAAYPADRWLTVRYEDVVAEPEQRFREILEHMRLDWTEGFARGLARYRFGAGRTDAFRRDLDGEDLAAMQEILGPQLTRHGYDPSA